METVIGALAEAAISNLLVAVTSLLKDKVDPILNAKDELKQLQGKLECLQKALKDADRKPFFSNERNRDLEGKLKEVVYDAQDIIEEYQTMIELSEREKCSMTSWNKVRKAWIPLCSCFKEHVSAPYHLGNEIKKINQRLKILEQPKVDLLTPKPKENIQGPIGGEDDNPRETTYQMDAQPPIGRENDKRVIVEKLLSNSSEQSSMIEKCDVFIISIIGQGGIGKTTLAKIVFDEVEQQFGERRWWVCVSEKPNRKILLQKILKEVCKGSKVGLEGISCLSDLCKQIQSELSKKRFLLVLDDVWELDWWHGEVESTLTRGAMGSKILITSRNIDVSKGVGALYMHRLPLLSEEDSWNLFLNKALKTKDDLASHNLEEIAKKIVKKCAGLPLVVQTVGSLMRTKSMEKAKWKVVADSVIWDWKMPASSSSSQYGSILSGLILSYEDLPPYLGNCFVYCCIYPKDYEIERETLIRQWVAHGLIEEREGIDVEEIANQYIDDLITRCLIETHDRFYEGTCLKLHDILDDLALYIGGKEYSHASSTEHTRHLSLLGVVDTEAPLQYIASGAANKVRTLLSASLSSVEFTNFKWLRVLSLRKCRMDELPNSIGCLSLLKYLDVSGSHVRQLPSSIGRLYNLQTLDLSHSKIEELPKEMGELCNLRYLGLKHTRSLKFMAEGFWKLTNLQTLHRFMVCDDKGKTRRGCNINELKDLKKLKGKLSIEGLRGGMVKVIDAKKGVLKEKHELIGVKFHFYFNFQEDNASEERGLLEALEPPHGIQSLKIWSYKGDRPVWYLDSNYGELRTLQLYYCPSWAAVIGTKSLEELSVEFCPRLCELPIMPLLKTLTIFRCHGLNRIGDLPALKSLHIVKCHRLNRIGDLPALESLMLWDLANWESTFTSMPCLRKAEFLNCPKMKMEGLIDELAGLQRLSVENCPSARLGWKLLEQLPNLIELKLDSKSTVLVPSPLPSQVSTFLPSLKTLDLTDNRNVDEEVKWGRVPEWVWGLSQLESLDLSSFSEDISLGGHWQCLPKLRELKLWYFPNLKFLVDVNNNITPEEQQNGTTCPSDAQQQQIACLSNLEELSINSCPVLELPKELRDHLGGRLHIYR